MARCPETTAASSAQDAPGPPQLMFDDDRASRLPGVELPGRILGTRHRPHDLTPATVNGHGIAHDGCLPPLADTVFACACGSHGPVTVAPGAEITFVAPARQGGVLHTEPDGGEGVRAPGLGARDRGPGRSRSTPS